MLNLDEPNLATFLKTRGAINQIIIVFMDQLVVKSQAIHQCV